MVKRYVVGNWKCYKTSADGEAWLDNFATLYREHPSLEVVVAPTMLSLEAVASHSKRLKLANFSIAAQDISPFPRGSYSGAVAADMVARVAEYVIVGHSERRRYFHETVQDVVNKVAEAADCGLTPIVCVEDLNVLSQLSALADIDCDTLIVAYTPVDAQSARIPRGAEKVAETVNRIQQFFPAFPVLYGGALHPSNVQDFLAIDGLAGLFVGEASLDPQSFAEICTKAVG